MPANCHFQIKWLDNLEYKKKNGWIGEVVRAKLNALCQKELDISNMSEAELKKSTNILNF